MTQFIAEFCQNHNGDLVLLEEMVHAAAEAGAQVGKIQTIFAEDLSHRKKFDTGRVNGNGVIEVINRPYAPEYERLKRLEIDRDGHAKFVEICKRRNLIPMTTCFTRASIEWLEKLDWGGIKVASYDCASYPLVRELSEKFPYLVVSTGATYQSEVQETAHILKTSGIRFALLHCVTIYPTPLAEVNLQRMNYLKQYSDSIGFSDHTLTKRDSIAASLAAIHLGANVIERHFTILPESESKDGPVSINGEQLKELAGFAQCSTADQKSLLKERSIDISLLQGDGHLDLSADERLNRDYYRGRFVSKRGGREVSNWEDTAL